MTTQQSLFESTLIRTQQAFASAIQAVREAHGIIAEAEALADNINKHSDQVIAVAKAVPRVDPFHAGLPPIVWVSIDKNLNQSINAIKKAGLEPEEISEEAICDGLSIQKIKLCGLRAEIHTRLE